MTQTGTIFWSKQAPTAANTSRHACRRFGLDTAESLLLVFSNFNTQIENSFILKYNASGTLLNNYGGDKLGQIKAFRVDASGNSYVAGGGIGEPSHWGAGPCRRKVQLRRHSGLASRFRWPKPAIINPASQIWPSVLAATFSSPRRSQVYSFGRRS